MNKLLCKRCGKEKDGNEWSSSKWCCKVCHAKYVREYRQTNKGYIKANRLYARNKKIQQIKKLAGTSSPVCSCCSESQIGFLELDKVLERILCCNCNKAIRVYGKCFHSLRDKELQTVV